MNPNEQEDRFGKWLGGNLSENEKEKITTGDLKVINKIVEVTAGWQIPPVKDGFVDFKNKKIATKKAGSLIKTWMKIAASVVIIAGISIFTYLRFFDIVTYDTVAGEILEISLPDGCKVTLNGKSSLTYNNYNWSNIRKVEVHGQAYFDVNKKGDFEVVFENGNVKVLGTRFDVLCHENLKMVKCFEGKVRVGYENRQVDLGPNEGWNLKNIERVFNFSGTISDWQAPYTSFDNVGFDEVIAAIEMRFGYDVKLLNSEMAQKRFTGRFKNSEPEEALELIAETMGFMLEKKDKTIYFK